jgi:ribosomal protein S18 acetylase RimI-like enzyme
VAGGLPLFRRAEYRDREEIMAVFDEARDFLRRQGVDQWQNGYPSASVIGRDIENGDAYVMETGGVAGYIAVCFGEEPSYARVYGGAWRYAPPYAALHRVAVARRCRAGGLAVVMLCRAQALCAKAGMASIRIDTHRQNLPMQRFLRKNGFGFCGLIYLEDGAERLAFDKAIALPESG